MKKMPKMDINGTIMIGLRPHYADKYDDETKAKIVMEERPALILANGPAIHETICGARRAYTISLDAGPEMGWLKVMSILNDFDRARLAARKIGSVMIVNEINPENILLKMKDTGIMKQIMYIREETLTIEDGTAEDVIRKAEKMARNKKRREEEKAFRAANGIPEPKRYPMNKSIMVPFKGGTEKVKAYFVDKNIVIYKWVNLLKVAMFVWEMSDMDMSDIKGRYTYYDLVEFGLQNMAEAVEYAEFVAEQNKENGVTTDNAIEKYRTDREFAKKLRDRYRETIIKIREA